MKKNIVNIVALLFGHLQQFIDRVRFDRHGKIEYRATIHLQIIIGQYIAVIGFKFHGRFA